MMTSCKSSAPAVHRSGTLAGNEKVLLLPFQNMAWLNGENVVVRSPLTGKVFMTGPVAEEAPRLLTDLLISALHQHTAFQTVPSREAPSIRDALQAASGSQTPPVAVLARTGRMVKADFVIQGYVYRFKERVGADYSAESPASVAFGVHFVDCREQTVVWSGYLDETQQALSEDLRYLGTFFRRGARWVTAEEMAREAMDAMFKEFTHP
jgi:ABC-type uncharacterized transport system auxiliary subunit